MTVARSSGNPPPGSTPPGTTPTPDPTELTQRAVDALRLELTTLFHTELDALDRINTERFASAKEAVASALASAEKAVEKAEVSSEKRLGEIKAILEALGRAVASALPRGEAAVAADATKVRIGQVEARLAELTTRADREEGQSKGQQNVVGFIAAGIGLLVGIGGLVATVITLSIR